MFLRELIDANFAGFVSDGKDGRNPGINVFPEAGAMPGKIARQERRGKPPQFKQVMTAMGVDKETGEVWIAVGNRLLRFDREGNQRAEFRIYTPKNSRLEAVAIVVEKDRLIIGGDPLGIYEFERLDKKKDAK